MSISALLVDDEEHNLTNLKLLLQQYSPQVSVCGMATNAELARTMIINHQPELLFLDIQMPGETGFDLLRSLPNPNFEVIFVTAYDQYALQAMRFAAVDYLLKPVNINELQLAVGRAIRQRDLKQGHQQLKNLINLISNQSGKEGQRIALSTLKETRFVKINDILRCESSNNYTTFYLTDGDVLLVSKPIYEYEELLKDFGFIRCHQSHLVNNGFIKSWKKDHGDFLLLTNGTEVPVSRGKREQVKALLRIQ
ncbi:DNA-binding response regulator [Mucilaginibacter sp. MD40]|uniref:LytR/AlgR family response regulator transcription factor n=1 Tax=Mucilaginibacter sp. MD40 TaxID=2029590 RepID=UPI000BACB062|nr:LytTR family DNA-binding domain-containing protein [Mucilaginibacter sp. MD40]PAW92289.1 DNA-binding response regulator [Mucilaginibacter sp. MD40]